MPNSNDSGETRSPALSRRVFLTAAVIGTATAGGLAFTSQPQAQPVGGGSSGGSEGSGGSGTAGTVRIRRNIFALAGTTTGDATIESYRRGVAAMKARPFSDVTSWKFQAAIHGPNPNEPDAFAALPLNLQAYLDPANLCQHFNFFFPAWHRMYLYYFERIVRKASGDPAFCLPYWNYSASTAERALPQSFRTPADEATNALFTPRRARSVNRGDPLVDDIVRTDLAFRETDAAAFYASMEDTPHGAVHVAVGGTTGFMRAFGTAALDPIFWLHHCNIDRMWAEWVRQGHRNINTSDFMDTSYTFFDEDGNTVSLKVSEILDTASGLDYRYDDGLAIEAGVVLAQGSGIESGRVPTALAATVGGPILLGAAPVATAADPLVEAGSAALFATDPAAPGAQPVMLVLDGIRFTEAPGLFFRIFVNHPSGSPYTLDAPSYAGTLAPFAPPGEGGYSKRFDISGLLNRQIAAGLFDGGQIQVEIVPANVEDPPDGIEAGPLPEISIDRVLIERQEP
jgi:hypothetical protein